MVPIALSEGMVAPSILRPSKTTLAPSQTMAQTGPDVMYEMSPGKNFFDFKSA